MTTPEQLAKWREEFEKTETNPYLEKTVLGMYAVTSIENRWQGYLRRCQETEQALKDARKQALEEVLALANDESTNYCNSDFFEFEQAIKELLND